MLKILIVDDDVGVIEGTQRYLRHKGNVVESTDSAEKALSLFEEWATREAFFDLVLFDFLGKNGQSALDSIEQFREISSETCFILHTGLELPEEVSVEVDRLFDFRLRKPYSLIELEELIVSIPKKSLAEDRG